MSKFNGYDKPFDLYITTLKNDETFGMWISFPTTPDALRSAFQTVGMGPSDWVITNADFHISGISHIVQSCESLDEINYLASKLSELDEEEVEQFATVIEIEEHNDSMEELINLCANLDCYNFTNSISDEEDLGRFTLRENTHLDRHTLIELDDYIDYESYGQNVVANENGMFADHCYVVPTNVGFVSYYSGDVSDIPEEYLVTGKIEVPELSDDERLNKAIELAIDLDALFRNIDPEYAAAYPNAQLQQEKICDSLYAGKVVDLETRLYDLDQDNRAPLSLALAEYKAAIRYDPQKDMPEETMTVLIVEPRKLPYVQKLAPGFEALSSVVGGTIAASYPFDDPVGLICNDDAHSMGMELNRALYNSNGQIYDVVPGTFVIVGLGEEDFTSLSAEMIEKYTRRFQTIEVYAKVGSRTVMFQIPNDNIADLSDSSLNSIVQSISDSKRPSIRNRLDMIKRGISDKEFSANNKSRNEPEL